jgi:uncharacterized membrane protein HdeD (DUF308 family)
MKNTTLSENAGYSITIGIVLLLIGLIVISAQVFTTFFSILLLGWGLIMGGIAQFIFGVFSGSWLKFSIAFMGGLINFAFGLILVLNPELSIATITLFIGIFLLIAGAYKAVTAVSSHNGWVLIGGLVSAIMGLFVLAQWPYSGMWVVGLFIGIELMISGFALIISSAEPVKEISPQQTPYLSGVKGGKAKTQHTEGD